jgi:Family of unknown function (DUF5719)
VTGRRLPVVLLIVALLVAGGVVDRRARPVVAEHDDTFAMPVASPAAALSATWYCAGASADGVGGADGAVVVANPTHQAVAGTVTYFPSDGRAPLAVPIDVPAMARTVVNDRDHITAPFVSALVELRGGGVVAEHTVSGPLGADVAPCAAAASDRWYFADGGTTRDARDVIALFNPFPEDAIVDMSFATDQGPVVPQSLQALVVPGRGMVPVNVGDHVLRRRAISVTIAARSGRLIADRIQTYDGTAGRKGLALVLGAPSPGPLWYFPDSYVATGLVERFQLYNPSTREARVSLEVGLDRGAAEPFDLAIPAGGRLTVKPADEARVPKDVAFSVTVRSENGVGVVVERSVDAAKPSGRLGLASTMGARLAARRWVFAAGLATAKVDEWVVLVNPGRQPARISFTALAGGQPLAIDGLQGFVLAPGRRTAVRLGDHVQRGDLALLVSASSPVVAERDLYRVGASGISTVMGIPLR